MGPRIEFPGRMDLVARYHRHLMIRAAYLRVYSPSQHAEAQLEATSPWRRDVVRADGHFVWAESEAAYERAVTAQFVDVNAFNWYSRMLGSVGDLYGSLRVARRGVELAPDSAVLNSRVAMVYTWLGDDDAALSYYERANALGADGSTHLMAYALLLNRMGKVEQSYAATRTGVEMEGFSGEWVDPVFAALVDPAAASEALEAVNAASDRGELAAQVEVVLRTFLDDVDGAMDIARRLEEPGEVFEMDLLYTPELRRLREHPEFPALMRRLGVQSWWRQNNCTFTDGDVSCPDA